MADKNENLAVVEKPKSDPLTNMFNVVSDIKQKPVGDRRQAFIEEQARILPEKIKADVDYQRAKFDLETSGKEARAKEGQAQTLLQETDIKQRREGIDKNALPVFSPTQEDLTSYAQLGSAIATLGLMLGGGGKVPAKAAISSMTGMLNGWRTGRKDLYERESKSFDKEFQRVTAIRKSLQDDLSTAMQLWPTKRKDAMDIIESLVNKTGAQSVFGKLLYSGQYKAASDFLGNAQKVEEAARIKDEENKRRDATAKATAAYRKAMLEKTPLKGAGKGLSQQQQGFEDMVSISINEAAAQVENLSTMKFSTTGIWQGRNTKGLLDAPLGVLANTLTTEDVQRYNAVISVLGREAAKVFAGGRIITDKAADQFSDQFKIKGGDKPFTVLEKMANIRQFFERAITVKQARPDVSPGMQEIYLNALTSFKEAIPITNKEVNEAKRIFDQSKGKSTKTFGEIIKEMGSAKPEAAAPAAPASPASPAAPVSAAPSIDKADLRLKAAAKIAEGAKKDIVAKRYKEITGEDY